MRGVLATTTISAVAVVAAALAPPAGAGVPIAASAAAVEPLQLRDTTPPQFGVIAAPASATAGLPTGFAATAADRQSGAVVIDWEFGDGSRASGGVVTHTFGAPGPGIVTLRATDAAGNTATATRLVAVRPFSVGEPVGGADVDPPAQPRVALTRTRFRAVGGDTVQVVPHDTASRAPASRGIASAVSSAIRHAASASSTVRHARPASGATPTTLRRAGAGTTIRVATGEPATIAVEIERRGFVHAALVRTSSGHGATTIRFTGRLASHPLPPGHYSANVSAVDAAGNRSATVHVAFTIVR